MDTILTRMKQDLARKRLAQDTQQRYLKTAESFFSAFPEQAPETLGREELRSFVASLEA